MHVLQITDLGRRSIQVSWHEETRGLRQSPQPVPFRDPLTAEDHAELRWYLEEYLQSPYGYQPRAEQVEERMAQWGEGLFKQVFPKRGPDPDPRSFYQEAVRAGLERCELCISSDDPTFLNIPWELLRDPVPGRAYLAPVLGGLYRQRRQKIEAPPPLPTAEPFRILLVIARPDGERDVPLGTVARPLLAALRSMRPHIQVDLLRPPTFDALQERLNSKRGYYQLVHFDGHGVFGASDATSRAMRFGGGQGYLAFETTDGGPHLVTSEDVGQALAACGVPLFVLNACQSAQEGKANPFSSVAAQLVATGARGVVAMAYSVYADAAAQFMKRFYEQLAQHASLAEAVAAGRRSLHASQARASEVGPLALRDWVVPTLYQQETRYVPIPSGVAEVAPGAQSPTDSVLRQAEAACPEGQFGFIGRDYDLLRIERALQDNGRPWVLLTGIGGTGKTALAYGFARWYAETGGCPEGVYVTSFKERASLAQVLGSIHGYGTDFSTLPEEEQERLVVEQLRGTACLLVWDNFEPVAGYPTGEEPLAASEELEKLARFLKALRGGRSRVLITTRKRDEGWLQIAYTLVEVGGLPAWDAGQLARVILETVGREPEAFRTDASYGRLLRLLRGHPRALEVVLPQLRDHAPAAIIEALQHEMERSESVLDASLQYAFSRLSERARRHLPVLGLFTSTLNLKVVIDFSAGGDLRREEYRELVGEALNGAAWRAVMAEASAAGLVRIRAGSLYELHPTLPVMLRRELLAAAGAAGLIRFDVNYMRYYAALASHFFGDVQRCDPQGMEAIEWEEPNLLRALRLGEANQRWAEVQAIVQTLGEYYDARGRWSEWATLRRALLGRVGRELPANADTHRSNLWMYLLGDEANERVDRNDLSGAETLNQQIRAYLVSRQDSAAEPLIAACYDQAGDIAEERQQFDEAEQWYQKALVIQERLGLERAAGRTYHQLGSIALERQELDVAEQWYRKALDIYERLRLEQLAADGYHQLGVIAQERGQLDHAERWYRKGLAIYHRLRREQYVADGYHQLGNIRQEQAQLDEAEQLYRKALTIYERLGLERRAAGEYHQLGVIAQLRGNLEQAELWYRKALGIFERLGLERDMADSYHQLGMVAQDAQEFDLAEELYCKALELLEPLGHRPLLIDTLAQMGSLKYERKAPQQAVLWLGRALTIADDFHMRISDRIIRGLATTLQFMGEERLAAAWRQAFPGEEPPLGRIRHMLMKLNNSL